MTVWEIRQEPGPKALRSAGRFGSAHIKRLGSGEAKSGKDALVDFIRNRYPQGHKQYVGHRLEWQSAAAMGNRWRPDDGLDPAHRRWRAVVSLANGRYVHDIILVAWRAS